MAPITLAATRSFRPVEPIVRLNEACAGKPCAEDASASAEAREAARKYAGEAGKASGNTAGDLTPEQVDQLLKLQARDREVRSHELAHAAAGAPYAGAPSYSYQRGPDGQRYAVGGEVSIDTAPIAGDPEATIAKLRIVQAAALAPADPSSQDRSIAAAAAQGLQQARQEAAAQAQAAGGEESGAIRAYRRVAGEENEEPGALIEAVA